MSIVSVPLKSLVALALWTLAVWPVPSPASVSEREISLPVRLDNAYLREVFVSQAFKEAGPSARVWDDGSGCNFMVISDPRISTRASGEDQIVTVTTASEARIGQRVGDRCVLLMDWTGTIETSQQVEVEPGGTSVHFRITDSEIRDETVHHGLRIGTLWDWIKEYVHPRLAAVRVDLTPALNDLRSVLQLVLPDRNQTLTASLESIALKSVEVVEGGLVAHLGMRIPADHSEPDAPAPALSAAELARFESAWQGWDSFVTFVVKHFAADIVEPELRRALLDVLIEARYDVIDILAVDTGERGIDPVRDLFVETWSRLAPLLRRVSQDLPQGRALNLLSFIAAADALQTLDALGPQFDLDISLAGLRRMARILTPESDTDPLIYDQRVDPELRELFDFGPPPRRRGSTVTPPQSLRRGLLPQFIPTARAADPLDDESVARLNRWVPERAELDAYLSTVHQLLDETSRDVAAQSRLEPELHELYRVLVLATAWQETCWRQYRRAGEQIVPIRSPAGAVGLMQVVPAVWRGFYEPNGLIEDIAYNATAGSEILMHYLTRYAIARGEHRQPGGEDNLAWATYAAYNGGPGHLRRYRASDTEDRLRSIDSAFRDKFMSIQNGDELAVRACYTE